MRLIAKIDGETLPVEIEKEGRNYRLIVGAREYLIDVAHPAHNRYSLIINNRVYDIGLTLNGDHWLVHIGGERFVVDLEDERRQAQRKSARADEDERKVIKAQMPGKVVRVLVSAGDQVEQDQGLLVIEAMKMQNEIKAPKPGRVTEIGVVQGATINAGDLLLVIE